MGAASAEGWSGAEPWQGLLGIETGFGMDSLFLQQTVLIPLTWGMALGTVPALSLPCPTRT